MDIKPVKDLIFHREPFLFVDTLEEVTEKGKKIVGWRKFTQDDFFFKGHFPDYPLVPGVILIESMAQCGGAGVIGAVEDLDNKLLFLTMIEKAKFRQRVLPGDEVRFEIETAHVDSRSVRQRGKAIVNGKVAAEASWVCMLGTK